MDLYRQFTFRRILLETYFGSKYRQIKLPSLIVSNIMTCVTFLQINSRSDYKDGKED